MQLVFFTVDIRSLQTKSFSLKVVFMFCLEHFSLKCIIKNFFYWVNDLRIHSIFSIIKPHYWWLLIAIVNALHLIIFCIAFCVKHLSVYELYYSSLSCMPKASVSGCGDKPGACLLFFFSSLLVPAVCRILCSNVRNLSGNFSDLTVASYQYNNTVVLWDCSLRYPSCVRVAGSWISSPYLSALGQDASAWWDGCLCAWRIWTICQQ